MAKKAVKKKTTKRKTVPKESNVEKILVENFVSLQKVMTNLSVKFDDLSGQISKLLDLFELSAKALAQKDIKFDAPPMDEKKILDKLGEIQDQNKTIARGLTLVHERIGGSPASAPPRPVAAAPPMKAPAATAPRTNEKYQKSPFKGF